TLAVGQAEPGPAPPRAVLGAPTGAVRAQQGEAPRAAYLGQPTQSAPAPAPAAENNDSSNPNGHGNGDKNGNGDKPEDADKEPEPPRRAMPAPWPSPPFPGSEYQGYPLIGVPESTSVYPFMKAVYGGPYGEEIKESRIKFSGWITSAGNWTTANNSNTPASY